MVYLYGASGHAKVIIGNLEWEKKIIGGLVDINPEIVSLLTYPVCQIVPEKFDVNEDSFIVSVGNNVNRKKIVNELKSTFSTSVHPSANVSSLVLIDEGTVVMAGATVNAESKIGRHVILNTNCSIDHDCLIDDFVHISPNVALAGDVRVGEGTHIGIGACVIPGIKIGKWAIIGAGAVVISDIPDYAIVVGNPGQIIKYQDEKSYV